MERYVSESPNNNMLNRIFHGFQNTTDNQLVATKKIIRSIILFYKIQHDLLTIDEEKEQEFSSAIQAMIKDMEDIAIVLHSPAISPCPHMDVIKKAVENLDRSLVSYEILGFFLGILLAIKSNITDYVLKQNTFRELIMGENVYEQPVRNMVNREIYYVDPQEIAIPDNLQDSVGNNNYVYGEEVLETNVDSMLYQAVYAIPYEDTSNDDAEGAHNLYDYAEIDMNDAYYDSATDLHNNMNEVLQTRLNNHSALSCLSLNCQQHVERIIKYYKDEYGKNIPLHDAVAAFGMLEAFRFLAKQKQSPNNLLVQLNTEYESDGMDEDSTTDSKCCLFNHCWNNQHAIYKWLFRFLVCIVAAGITAYAVYFVRSLLILQDTPNDLKDSNTTDIASAATPEASSYLPPNNDSNASYNHPDTPSVSPTYKPSVSPTNTPTYWPSFLPTFMPWPFPSMSPSSKPSTAPTNTPTYWPSFVPTFKPTSWPSFAPSNKPLLSKAPSANPSQMPSASMTTISIFTPQECDDCYLLDVNSPRFEECFVNFC